jgi:hypothetical protein
MLVSSLAIIQIRTLSLLQKTVQFRDQLFLYTDPEVTSSPRTICLMVRVYALPLLRYRHNLSIDRYEG